MQKYDVEFKQVKPWLVKFKVNGVWFMLHESSEIDSYGANLYRIYMDKRGQYTLRHMKSTPDAKIVRSLRTGPDFKFAEFYTPKSQISVPFFLGWLDAHNLLVWIENELELERRSHRHMF